MFYRTNITITIHMNRQIATYLRRYLRNKSCREIFLKLCEVFTTLYCHLKTCMTRISSNKSQITTVTVVYFRFVIPFLSPVLPSSKTFLRYSSLPKALPCFCISDIIALPVILFCYPGPPRLALLAAAPENKHLIKFFST